MKVMCDNCGAFHPHEFPEGILVEGTKYNVLGADGWTEVEGESRPLDLCADCSAVRSEA